jgi:aldose 1-epimerase
MTHAPLALSGARFDLTAGEYTASISAIGASLRTLQFRGRDLVVPFDEDELRPSFRGATLAPWPNRVVDGRYTFAGVEQQLSLTEPPRGHALHGLAAWLNFEPVEQSDSRVVVSAVIEPQAGYPHRVRVDVEFELDEHGLRSTVSGHNLSDAPAPWGTGPHPYLVAGAGRVDDWTLSLPAGQVLTVDERLSPVALADVATEADGSFDFRAPRPIGDLFIDHAFTDLGRAEDGNASVTVSDSAGSGVRISWGTECAWVQVHTADLPDAATSRLGLAVEPMTCPPDAFNSGEDLIVIEAGQSVSAAWTIAAV